MTFTFRGYLNGYLCKHCIEPLSGVDVKIYRHRDDQNITELAVNAEKTTFKILTEEEVNAKKNCLLVQASTDDKGQFTFALNEKEYHGEPFEIDVYLKRAPGAKPARTNCPPLQFTITTVTPKWRDHETGAVAGWEYSLPYRYWCAIRARLCAWTICGQVTVCDTQIPVQGVRVRACDADLIQDDFLGSAITDSSGRFRIDYTTEDFRKTPLSPWINWESVAGPDVYFEILTPSGVVLLKEPRSRGRDSDRENVGHCFCVDLCLKKLPEGHGNHTYPLFTQVGQYQINADFSAAGLTNSGGYAFTRNIPLMGIKPSGDDPLAMEYRFRVGKYSSGVLGPLIDVEAPLVAATVIGKLEFWKLNGAIWKIEAVDFWVNNPSAAPYNVNIKPGGWIEVPREQNIGLPPLPGPGKFVANDNLLNLITTELSSEAFDLTAPTVHLAGNALPAPKKATIDTFSIVFEARVVGSLPITDTNTLTKIVFCNTKYKQLRHPLWAGNEPILNGVAMLDIKEMVTSGMGCGKLTNQLHALYTVYHPFLKSVQLHFEGNPPVPGPFSPAILGDEAVSSSAGHLFDISAQKPCAYILWLKASVGLTQGWGLISDHQMEDHIAYCKG